MWILAGFAMTAVPSVINAIKESRIDIDNAPFRHCRIDSIGWLEESLEGCVYVCVESSMRLERCELKVFMKLSSLPFSLLRVMNKIRIWSLFFFGLCASFFFFIFSCRRHWYKSLFKTTSFLRYPFPHSYSLCPLKETIIFLANNTSPSKCIIITHVLRFSFSALHQSTQRTLARLFIYHLSAFEKLQVALLMSLLVGPFNSRENYNTCTQR